MSGEKDIKALLLRLKDELQFLRQDINGENETEGGVESPQTPTSPEVLQLSEARSNASSVDVNLQTAHSETWSIASVESNTPSLASSSSRRRSGIPQPQGSNIPKPASKTEVTASPGVSRSTTRTKTQVQAQAISKPDARPTAPVLSQSGRLQSQSVGTAKGSTSTTPKTAGKFSATTTTPAKATTPAITQSASARITPSSKSAAVLRESQSLNPAATAALKISGSFNTPTSTKPVAALAPLVTKGSMGTPKASPVPSPRTTAPSRAGSGRVTTSSSTAAPRTGSKLSNTTVAASSGPTSPPVSGSNIQRGTFGSSNGTVARSTPSASSAAITPGSAAQSRRASDAASVASRPTTAGTTPQVLSPEAQPNLVYGQAAEQQLGLLTDQDMAGNNHAETWLTTAEEYTPSKPAPPVPATNKSSATTTGDSMPDVTPLWKPFSVQGFENQLFDAPHLSRTTTPRAIMLHSLPISNDLYESASTSNSAIANVHVSNPLVWSVERNAPNTPWDAAAAGSPDANRTKTGRRISLGSEMFEQMVASANNLDLLTAQGGAGGSILDSPGRGHTPVRSHTPNRSHTPVRRVPSLSADSFQRSLLASQAADLAWLSSGNDATAAFESHQVDFEGAYGPDSNLLAIVEMEHELESMSGMLLTSTAMRTAAPPPEDEGFQSFEESGPVLRGSRNVTPRASQTADPVPAASPAAAAASPDVAKSVAAAPGHETDMVSKVSVPVVAAAGAAAQDVAELAADAVVAPKEVAPAPDKAPEAAAEVGPAVVALKEVAEVAPAAYSAPEAVVGAASADLAAEAVVEARPADFALKDAAEAAADSELEVVPEVVPVIVQAAAVSALTAADAEIPASAAESEAAVHQDVDEVQPAAEAAVQLAAEETPAVVAPAYEPFVVTADAAPVGMRLAAAAGLTEVAAAAAHTDADPVPAEVADVIVQPDGVERTAEVAAAAVQQDADVEAVEVVGAPAEVVETAMQPGVENEDVEALAAPPEVTQPAMQKGAFVDAVELPATVDAVAAAPAHVAPKDAALDASADAVLPKSAPAIQDSSEDIVPAAAAAEDAAAITAPITAAIAADDQVLEDSAPVHPAAAVEAAEGIASAQADKAAAQLMPDTNQVLASHAQLLPELTTPAEPAVASGLDGDMSAVQPNVTMDTNRVDAHDTFQPAVERARVVSEDLIADITPVQLGSQMIRDAGSDLKATSLAGTQLQDLFQGVPPADGSAMPVDVHDKDVTAPASPGLLKQLDLFTSVPPASSTKDVLEASGVSPLETTSEASRVADLFDAVPALDAAPGMPEVPLATADIQAGEQSARPLDTLDTTPAIEPSDVQHVRSDESAPAVGASPVADGVEDVLATPQQPMAYKPTASREVFMTIEDFEKVSTAQAAAGLGTAEDTKTDAVSAEPAAGTTSTAAAAEQEPEADLSAPPPVPASSAVVMSHSSPESEVVGESLATREQPSSHGEAGSTPSLAEAREPNGMEHDDAHAEESDDDSERSAHAEASASSSDAGEAAAGAYSAAADDAGEGFASASSEAQDVPGEWEQLPDSSELLPVEPHVRSFEPFTAATRASDSPSQPADLNTRAKHAEGAADAPSGETGMVAVDAASAKLDEPATEAMGSFTDKTFAAAVTSAEPSTLQRSAASFASAVSQDSFHSAVSGSLFATSRSAPSFASAIAEEAATTNAEPVHERLQTEVELTAAEQQVITAAADVSVSPARDAASVEGTATATTAIIDLEDEGRTSRAGSDYSTAVGLALGSELERFASASSTALPTEATGEWAIAPRSRLATADDVTAVAAQDGQELAAAATFQTAISDADWMLQVSPGKASAHEAAALDDKTHDPSHGEFDSTARSAGPQDARAAAYAAADDARSGASRHAQPAAEVSSPVVSMQTQNSDMAAVFAALQSTGDNITGTAPWNAAFTSSGGAAFRAAAAEAAMVADLNSTSVATAETMEALSSVSSRQGEPSYPGAAATTDAVAAAEQQLGSAPKVPAEPSSGVWEIDAGFERERSGMWEFGTDVINSEAGTPLARLSKQVSAADGSAQQIAQGDVGLDAAQLPDEKQTHPAAEPSRSAPEQSSAPPPALASLSGILGLSMGVPPPQQAAKPPQESSGTAVPAEGALASLSSILSLSMGVPAPQPAKHAELAASAANALGSLSGILGLSMGVQAPEPRAPAAAATATDAAAPSASGSRRSSQLVMVTRNSSTESQTAAAGALMAMMLGTAAQGEAADQLEQDGGSWQLSTFQGLEAPGVEPVKFSGSAAEGQSAVASALQQGASTAAAQLQQDGQQTLANATKGLGDAAEQMQSMAAARTADAEIVTTGAAQQAAGLVQSSTEVSQGAAAQAAEAGDALKGQLEQQAGAAMFQVAETGNALKGLLQQRVTSPTADAVQPALEQATAAAATDNASEVVKVVGAALQLPKAGAREVQQGSAAASPREKQVGGKLEQAASQMPSFEQRKARISGRSKQLETAGQSSEGAPVRRPTQEGDTAPKVASVGEEVVEKPQEQPQAVVVPQPVAAVLAGTGVNVAAAVQAVQRPLQRRGFLGFFCCARPAVREPADEFTDMRQ